MFEARRPWGRLFYWLLLLWAPLASGQAPLTTINDVVYRADGTPAGGTLLISWPAFTTSGGQVVAAGDKSVTLGSSGALAVQLAATSNATPVNTVYIVVYPL